MKILVVHNHYQQRGGEDQVFSDETALLEAQGRRVLRYEVSNDEIRGMHILPLALKTVWNRAVYKELRSLIRRQRPDVVHFHNTFPLVSPAAYHAAKAEGAAVVQTLHNYRLLCPNALFFRNGGPCEDCIGKRFPWPGIVHACYRRSRPASATVAVMLAVHKSLRTFSETVDLYVALTGFARQKFIEGGLAGEKIAVKPHFVAPDPGARDGGGGYALFVGRLSPEKGVETLISAWDLLQARMPLKIVGDGPLASKVAEASRLTPAVDWLGRKAPDQVLDLMGDAAFLVIPSEWYETFGRVAIEAFARGTPVIASRLGAMAELIDDGHTGLLFRHGDAENLAAKVEWAIAHPEALVQMRRAARAEFEQKYTAERNYVLLAEIYQRALEVSQSGISS